MLLNDLLDSKISTVSANDYAAEALRFMAVKRTAYAFVLDRDELVGMVFARDLERLPHQTLFDRDVREFTRPNLLLVDVGTPPQEAVRLLRASGQPFLTVVKEEMPVGIVTQESLLAPGATTMRSLKRQARQVAVV